VIDWLTPAEVCEELKINDVHKVLAWIKSKKLIAVNLSSGKRPTWRIKREDLEAFLAGRTSRPDPKPPLRQRKRREVIQFF
jgi:excisionase family DNA binding protein